MRTLLHTLLLSIAIIIIGKVSDAQKKWSMVGANSFSTVSYSVSIAIGTADTPYVAFIDTANNNEIIVNKFDGTNWVPVGSTGFHTGQYGTVWLTIDDKGTPYVAYYDNNNLYELVVIKYNGSSWVQAGTTGLGVNLTSAWGNPLAAGKNGKIYAVGNFLGKAAVVKYDGTNWSPVGNLGFSDTVLTYATIDVDSKDNPCIAFEDDSVVAIIHPNTYVIMKRVTVMQYDGSNWKTLGGPGYKILNAWDPVINFDSNDTAYVSYTDRGNQYKASVRKFFDTGVTIVGSLGFSSGSSDFLSSTVDKNDDPYIVYSSSGGSHAMVFNGTSWTTAGKIGFTNSTAWRYSMATDNNNAVYVAFLETSVNKITVMKYDYCPPLPKVNLCAVLNDTITYNNIVAWENNGFPNIDSYKIYRENNGKYELIGGVGANQYQYKDTIVSPFSSSYRYKLAVLDSCGVETILDSVNYHKTVLLTFNYLIDNKASITWSKYEGIANPVYNVMRNNNSNSFVQIESFTMLGNDTTYIDNNPTSGNNEYRIDIALANPCNSYSKITSNTVTSWKTGIEEHTKMNAVSIAPNPGQTELTVNAPEIIEYVSVFTITGRMVMSKEITGFSKKITIEIKDLPTGTYLLRVNNTNNTIFIKE